jgi:hypothetical protein
MSGQGSLSMTGRELHCHGANERITAANMSLT